MRLTFRISKRNFFLVTVGGQTYREPNETYFATSTMVLNHTRTDWSGIGQTQKSVLPKGSVARRFFEKWDKMHLCYISKFDDEQLSELHTDIEGLKVEYPYIVSDSFHQIVDFDREESKKEKNGRKSK